MLLSKAIYKEYNEEYKEYRLQIKDYRYVFNICILNNI